MKCFQSPLPFWRFLAAIITLSIVVILAMLLGALTLGCFKPDCFFGPVVNYFDRNGWLS
jgi:hypothetical protein